MSEIVSARVVFFLLAHCLGSLDTAFFFCLGLDTAFFFCLGLDTTICGVGGGSGVCDGGGGVLVGEEMLCVTWQGR